MISYFGLPLLEATPQIDAWATSLIDPSWSSRALARDVPGRGAELLGQPGSERRGPDRINALSWPLWGASRWAEGLYLCDDATLLGLRQRAFASGAPVAGPLVLDDGESAVTMSMYMLPARPLAQADPRAGSLWLLTLVDRRYFWWYSASDEASLAISGGTTTWASVVSQLASALSLTLGTTDEAHADYLYPPSELAGLSRPIPLLLDAAAAATGRRLCFGTGGGAYVYSADSSLTLHAANLRAYSCRLAGGALEIVEPYAPDAPAELPASVTVFYPRASGPLPPYGVEVTLASLGLDTLFGQATGFSGTKCLHSFAQAGDGATPANATELLAMATRTATDWYKHRAGRADARLAGVAGWSAEGLSDLEYEHRLGRVSTRVTRPPSLEHLEDLTQRSSLPGTHTYYGPDDAVTVGGTLTFAGGEILLEDGAPLLLEDETGALLEGGPVLEIASGAALTIPSGSEISIGSGSLLLEDGTAIWLEDGEDVLPEGGSSGVTVSGPGWLVVTAPLEVCGTLALCASTPPTFTATQNNLDPGDGKFLVRLEADAPRDLTGIVPQSRNGDAVPQLLVLENVGGTHPITLTHEDTGSTDTNRFALPDGKPLQLAPTDSVMLWYDTTTERWRPLSGTATPYPRTYAPSLTGSHNNYSITAGKTALIPSLTGNVTFTGLADIPVGRPFPIVNPTGSGFDITLSHLSGSSSSGNQFAFSDGASKTLSPGEGLTVINDGAKLVEIGSSFSLAGGGVTVLDDLSDVVITTPSDGDVLTYDSGSGDWVNAAPPAPSGVTERTEGTLAAAGSTQGDAAAIVTDAVMVSGADGTKGVILPDVAGAIVLVGNDSGSSSLKVYPHSGAAIDLGGTNAAVTLLSKAWQVYFRISSTQWLATNSGILP